MQEFLLTQGDNYYYIAFCHGPLHGLHDFGTCLVQRTTRERKCPFPVLTNFDKRKRWLTMKKNYFGGGDLLLGVGLLSRSYSVGAEADV